METDFENPPQEIKILLIDDDEVDYILTDGLLSEINNNTYKIDWINKYNEALTEIKNQNYDVYLIDYRLGMDSGLDLVRNAIKSGCEKPMIMLTGKGNRDLDYQAMKIGAYDYLDKDGMNSSLLERAIRFALNNYYQRKQIIENEKIIKESEELHRITLSSISDAVFITKDDGSFTYICPNLDVIFKFTKDEVSSKGNISYLLGEYQLNIDKLNSQGELENIELEINDKIGDIHTILMNVKRVSIKGGTILYTCRDITNRKLMENELLASEIKYRTLFEETKDAICITDDKYRIIDSNKSFQNLFHYSIEEITLLRFGDMFCDNRELDEFKKEVKSVDFITNMEIRFKSKYNNEIIGLLTCSKRKNGNMEHAGCNIIIHDITEHFLQNQRLQSKKIESIGSITGGFAHEFNNILMKISGYSDLLQNTIEPNSKTYENIQKIKNTIVNARNLTSQLVLYAGELQIELEKSNLNDLVENVTESIKQLFPKTITIKCIFDYTIPQMKIDRERIKMSLLNLIKNATEAIGSEIGVITISTGQEILDQTKTSDLYFTHDIQFGSYLYIAVTDTGIGMDQETLDQIFDPFFTTKFLGRGMGLAVVSGIVRAHNGAIKVFSNKGRGTSIKILLPIPN